jgi:hypothetical protein
MGRLRALLGLAIALAASPAVAQNLVANPNFATAMLPEWTAWAGDLTPGGTGTAAWIGTQDVLSDPLSGAAQVDFAATPTTPNVAYGIRQCVDLSAVAPVTQAKFGAKYKTPTGQTPAEEVSVQVEVFFYSAAGCNAADFLTGGQAGKVIAAADLSDTVWPGADVSTPDFDLSATPGALSAEIRGAIERIGTNGTTLTGYFDNLYLAVNGTTPVELMSFTAE